MPRNRVFNAHIWESSLATGQGKSLRHLSRHQYDREHVPTVPKTPPTNHQARGRIVIKFYDIAGFTSPDSCLRFTSIRTVRIQLCVVHHLSIHRLCALHPADLRRCSRSAILFAPILRSLSSLISFQNARNDRMSYHVIPRQVNDADTSHINQTVNRIGKSRAGPQANRSGSDHR